MIRHDIPGMLEEVAGQPIEYLSLEWDRLLQDVIEGGNAIRCYEDYSVSEAKRISHLTVVRAIRGIELNRS